MFGIQAELYRGCRGAFLTVLCLVASDAVAIDQKSPPAESVEVIVEFTGLSTSADILKVVSSMYSEFGNDTIAPKPVTAQKGDSPCALLRQALQLPGCPAQEVRETFEVFNHTKDGDLYPGKAYQIPNVDISAFTYTTIVDEYNSKPFRNDPFDSSEILRQQSWNPFVRSVQRGNPGSKSLVELEGKRVKLRMKDADAAIQAIKHVQELDLQSVTVHTNISSTGRSKYSQHFVAPKAQNGVCPTPEGQEGAYWHLLDWLTQWDVPQCAKDCTPGVQCPQIVLVDQTIHPHTELKSHVTYVNLTGEERDYSRPEYCGDGTAVEPADQCRFEDFRRQCHHGTSLASVIGSVHNGSGFAGLSPANQVISFDWNLASTDDLIHLVRQRSAPDFQDINGPQIYLFASKFPDIVAEIRREADANDFSTPSYSETFLNGEELKDPETRHTEQGTVAAILAARQLWIVAAGQPDSGAPHRLHERSPFAPMNLGDNEHVVVVTACEKCGWPEANIYRGANFADLDDKQFVTIAAPGFGYLTPRESDDSYAKEHGGTSQAAAFVAGLAAAMVNCAPDSYTQRSFNGIEAAALKKRLVVTSRPMLQKDGSGHFTPGIVDPQVALLDPRKDWYLELPQLGGADYSNASVDHWCKERIEYSYEDGQRGSKSTKNTLRVRSIPDKFWPDGNRRWYIYGSLADPTSNRATVDIVGPVLLDPAFEEQALVKLSEGSTLKLGELDDLILSRHKPWAQQCNSQ